jgi:uncharacterized protein YbjT (DUF2867 family)
VPVRCSWFAQNFSEDYLLEAVLAGEIALPVADMPEPFVEVDDIADVAVAALTEDGHSGQLYGVPGDVTGLLRYLFTEVLDGRNAKLADGVQRALGRQPRDFAYYARDAAATGVWDV